MANLRKSDDQYDEQETERRREAALKRMLSTPHQPHAPLGKRGNKPAARKQRAAGKSSEGKR